MNWNRMLCATAFLEPNKVESAFDELSEYQFDKDSPKYSMMMEARDDMCAYFRDTWLEGSFPIKSWNQFGKKKDLTNNQNEGQ